MTFSRLQQEVQQAHATRVQLYQRLEKLLGEDKKVVAFFTSFSWPVVIQDLDCDMLEEVLHNIPGGLAGKHLVLMLNSPGGEVLPAERVVNIFRSFGNGSFSVIVPKMAKSAATMICLGADEIGMCKTSELGPIDPQIAIRDERGQVVDYKAAHEIIESYNDLIRKANRTRGRIEPFLQQLARFDARDIREIISHQQLSESIALRCLGAGMLRHLGQQEIKRRIKPFLDPTHTKVHGRPIYYDVAKKSGLTVKLYDLRSDLWQTVWELYIRLNYLVSFPMGECAKIIETTQDAYHASPPDLRMARVGLGLNGAKQ